jgi:hypothetical protein
MHLQLVNMHLTAGQRETPFLMVNSTCSEGYTDTYNRSIISYRVTERKAERQSQTHGKHIPLI